jgi:hypothetical protein
MARGLSHKTDSALCILLVLCFFGSSQVIAAPYPEPPGLAYPEELPFDPSHTLVDKMERDINMKMARIANEVVELEEEKLELAILKNANKASPQQFPEQYAETLPEPSPRIQEPSVPSGKRTSYMALCHFKICNMGRKRQM